MRCHSILSPLKKIGMLHSKVTPILHYAFSFGCLGYSAHRKYSVILT